MSLILWGDVDRSVKNHRQQLLDRDVVGVKVNLASLAVKFLDQHHFESFVCCDGTTLDCEPETVIPPFLPIMDEVG